MALLCLAQKLLFYADVIASAQPQNAAEISIRGNLKPLQLRGRHGPGLCSVLQDRKHQAANILVLVRVEMSLLRQSFAARCTAAPAAATPQLISLSRLQSALQ
jgi:hypothetical protein